MLLGKEKSECTAVHQGVVMTKAILALRLRSCWRIIRFIPFLADSGAFVAGVLALLSQVHMNLVAGIGLVVLVLVGLDALVTKLARSKGLDQNGELPAVSERDEIRSQTSPQESRPQSGRPLHASILSERENTGIASTHRWRLTIVASQRELRVSPDLGPLRITIAAGQANETVIEIRQESE